MKKSKKIKNISDCDKSDINCRHVNLFNKTNDRDLIERAISQNLDNENYTKEELDTSVISGGLVYVESYTRDDGTEVSGYYRRR